MSIRAIDGWKKATGKVICHDFRKAGSGFFVGSQGLLVTNNHVVSKMTIDDKGTIRVDYSAHISVKVGENSYVASLAIDENADRPIVYDYAILKVEVKPLFHLGTGLSEVWQGDDVLAIGYPLGHDDPIVSGGVVSAIISRPSHINAIHRMKTILTDTLITYGNSGGPLIRKSDGNVIAVTTMPHEIGDEVRQRLQKYVNGPNADPIISDLIKFTLDYVNVGFNYAISIEHALSDPVFGPRVG